ncbi:DUF3987 domain-containing protein [Streptomyces sp. NPDC054932]
MTTHAVDPQAVAETPLAGALWLAQRQFAVFTADHPGAERCAGIGYGHDANTCADRGKHPAEPFTKTTYRDEQEVRRLFSGAPRNVGVYVGGSRGPNGEQLLVVDSDRPGAIEDVAKAFGETWPSTMRVGTAKGHHDYVWTPAGLKLGNGLGALKGKFDGDVRAGNAYVIGPGSVHATGVVYTLEDPEQPPVAAPAWLLEALQARVSAPVGPATDIVIPADRHDVYTRKVVQAECDAITRAAEGEQNNAINTAAFALGSLVGAGALTEAEARADLLAAAHAGNHPEGRARATIESGLRAGMAQPRHPWPPPARAGSSSDFPRQQETPSPDGWEEPVRLAPPPPPELDVKLLGAIGEMAAAVSTSLQVPVDIPAWFGMAAASAAIGGRRTVSPKPDWSEPVTLYCMTVAAPGEKKSPSRAAMVAPLAQEEQRRKAADKLTVARDQQDRRIAEACVAAAETQVIKTKGAPARQKARQELDAVRDELEQLGEPKVITQMLADDTTPEAAAGVLAEQGERLAVISAEGGFLGNIGGRYSNQPNLEIVLKAWSHEPHTVNRKSGPPLFLDRPSLTLALAVQPGLLSGLGDTAEVFEARGLTGRFIFAVPASLVGQRTYDTARIPDDVRRRYAESITRMIKLIWDDSELREMALDEDAQAIFKAFWEDWERRHLVPGDLTAVEGWSKKLPGQILRLAAVMTLFDAPSSFTVSSKTMANAVALVPYLLGHARLVVDLMSAEKQSKLGPARAVLEWLRKKQPAGPVSVTDVRRGVHGQSWCDGAEDVAAALLVLDRNGWIRFLPAPEPTGGRPPAPRFLVHPRVLEPPR